MLRTRRLALCLALVLSAALPAAQDAATSRPPRTFEQIVGPAKVEKVADGFKFVEGPAWDYKSLLVFSDIPNNHIIQVDASGKTSVFRADSGGANGLMFDAKGRLVACEGSARRISRLSEGKWETVADRYDGKKLNSPNDLCIDAAGRIYFTDPRYGRGEPVEQDKEAVYRVDIDGKVARVVSDCKKPNGIALSPDGKTLYVVDNGAGVTRAYPLAPDGSVGEAEGKTLCKSPGGDGMAVDSDGNLYITTSRGVLVADPSGKELGVISVPEGPANCCFGGPKVNTLYITARKGFYKIDLNARGWQVQIDGVMK